MNTMITVMLNETTDDETGRPVHFDGYKAGHVLRPVLMVKREQIESVPQAVHDDWRTLERVFHLLNVGDDPEFGQPHPVAVEYRARGNRSLSVGDVVVLDNRWYSCEGMGWRHIEPDNLGFLG